MSSSVQLIAALVVVGLAAAYLACRALRRIKLFLWPGESRVPCDQCRGGCAGKPFRDRKGSREGRSQ